MTTQTEGRLRVWWIRNVPNKPEYHPANSMDEAIEIYEALMLSDLHDDSVTSNVGGLEVFEDGWWSEWYDERGEGFNNHAEAIIRERRRDEAETKEG